MKNSTILEMNMCKIEDMLVRKYLRKYVDGFTSRDIKSLETDCIKCDVSYHIVRRKISEKADECR